MDMALDLQKESSEECWKDHSIANSLEHLMECWKAPPDGTTLGVMLEELYGLLLGPADGKLDGVLEGILDEWRQRRSRCHVNQGLFPTRSPWK